MGWTGAVTAQTRYVNPAGKAFDIEISQGNGVTAWRVKGTDEWVRDGNAFYKSLGSNLKSIPAAPLDTSGGGPEGGYVPWSVPATTPSITPTTIASSVQAELQKSARTSTVAKVTSSLTDSIPRPKTAQATPSPVSRFKMKKTKGRFVIGI